MTHFAEGQGCWLNWLRSLISLLLEQVKAKSDLTHWYKAQISTLPRESCCGAVLGKFKEYRSLSRMPDGKTCPKKATVLHCPSSPHLTNSPAVLPSEVIPISSSCNILNNPWARVGQHWSWPTCTSHTQNGWACSAGVKGKLDHWRAPKSQAEQHRQQHLTKRKGTTLLLMAVFTGFYATWVAMPGCLPGAIF